MQSLKYLGIYFLGIISFFLFNELLNLFSDSNTFLFLLIFLVIPFWIFNLLFVILPPIIFINCLFNPQLKIDSFKKILIFVFRLYFIKFFGFFNLFQINRILKYRLINMGESDYMEPTISKGDSIIYKLFDKKITSLNNNQIVIFRNKFDICIGRISSIKKDFISIKLDNKNYIDEYKEWNRIPIVNIIGILIFNLNPSKNPLIKN